MAHTTHTTALALRAAGFPIPLPEWGQVWYDPDGAPHVFNHIGSDPFDIHKTTYWVFVPQYSARSVAVLPEDVRRKWVYAPTLSDFTTEDVEFIANLALTNLQRNGTSKP